MAVGVPNRGSWLSRNRGTFAGAASFGGSESPAKPPRGPRFGVLGSDLHRDDVIAHVFGSKIPGLPEVHARLARLRAVRRQR
jgi:hypothetical protein